MTTDDPQQQPPPFPKALQMLLDAAAAEDSGRRCRPSSALAPVPPLDSCDDHAATNCGDGSPLQGSALDHTVPASPLVVNHDLLHDGRDFRNHSMPRFESSVQARPAALGDSERLAPPPLSNM
ncbi:hypothetical protein HK405_001886, partial [Cladochytrium tenue]